MSKHVLILGAGFAAEKQEFGDVRRARWFGRAVGAHAAEQPERSS